MKFFIAFMIACSFMREFLYLLNSVLNDDERPSFWQIMSHLLWVICLTFFASEIGKLIDLAGV